MTVRLLDFDRSRRAWFTADGGAAEARDRIPESAWQLLDAADRHGLAVHVKGTASTDIIGTLGSTLTVTHRVPEPGRQRQVRVRLCRNDGTTITRYTLAEAHAWIATQPVDANAARA